MGATSLAVNSALRLSGEADGSALLCDFDLNCGIVRFLLKLNGTDSVVDAAERATTMEENLGVGSIEKSGKLDVLHAGTLNPSSVWSSCTCSI